jgi:RNA polymerase-binding transcription factor DksA
MSAKTNPPSTKSPAKAKTPAAKPEKTDAPEKASKPAKKPAPAKAAAAPVEKKAAPVKKAAEPAKKPAKKPAAPTQKATVEKKVSGDKKASTPKAKTVAADPASPAEKKPVAKSAPAPKVAAPAKEAKEVKAAPKPAEKPQPIRRSSLVDFPVPPPPVKPPFVPPPKVAAPTDGPVAPGSNGTHSPAFIQKQRQRLLDLRDDLVDAMSGMTRDTIRNAPEGSEASGSGMHQGDAGSDAYDRDFALSVLAKEQDALYEIEQALRRIQKGNYGLCEMSNRKIPQPRLEAIPFARLTVECQAQWEKEYGNRRFRPSNEVGFSGGNTMDDEDSDTVSLDEDED